MLSGNYPGYGGSLPLETYLFTIYHMPFTIYHLPSTIYHLPFTIYHLPFTIFPKQAKPNGVLTSMKEGPKGFPGLKVDFQTIPIAIPIAIPIDSLRGIP